MKKATLNIKGMSCAHCVNKVETALQGQQGVEKAKVNLKKEIAKIKYDETIQTLDHLILEVKEVGYEAEPAK
ncbi:copper chaperone CopZ [Desemzia sp. RIT804]|uniref:copper chaperone CopZ n=1 Tax=Desemzia sp. RIT 804 TaxID=2810209 RepID=UPI00194F3DEA|nr:copper chaperone CopZ [Desemzia sp. RIT 804]MBM6614961.1 copper chaperone CopZ [Desemzia sp. RIT 804]